MDAIEPFIVLNYLLFFLLLASQPVEALTQPLRLRTPPLPVGIVAGILVLVFIGNALPFLEKLVRALRYRANRKLPLPE